MGEMGGGGKMRGEMGGEMEGEMGGEMGGEMRGVTWGGDMGEIRRVRRDGTVDD